MESVNTHTDGRLGKKKKTAAEAMKVKARSPFVLNPEENMWVRRWDGLCGSCLVFV